MWPIKAFTEAASIHLLQRDTNILVQLCTTILHGRRHPFEYGIYNSLVTTLVLALTHQRPPLLGASKRLIDPPSIVLRVVGNRVRRLLAAQPVDVGRIARGDGEPVLIGLGIDLLALVEVALHTGTEDIAAEVGRQLHVEVDILAVFVHALSVDLLHGLGGIALSVVGAVGCPGDPG